MVRRCTALLLLLSACEPGPNVETLVDSLQVIAAVAEPPEVALFEPYELTVTTIDPDDEGFDVLVWSCVEDCEVVSPTRDAETSVATLVPVAPVPTWILACAPGVCDLESPPDRDLQDPFEWLQRLPQEGVSLASRWPRIVDQTGDRHQNPFIDSEPALERLTVKAERSTRLEFVVPGAETAWTYATAGGFRRPSEDIASDGAVTVQWYAPEAPGEVDLYVVFVDDRGGAVLWRETATVK